MADDVDPQVVRQRRGPGQRQRRRTDRAGVLSTSVSGGTAIVVPGWVKIVRAGNLLSGYQSKDGVNWTPVGSANIAMGTSVMIGLAVTSHDFGRYGTAYRLSAI